MSQGNSKNIQAAKYFDDQAGAYMDRSHQGIWDAVRRKEAETVLRAVGDPVGQSFFDLGSGAGYYASYFSARGASSVHAVDLSAAMIESLPKGIQGTVADITTCRLDKKFSRIVCAGALEFVDKPGAVFETAYKHAEPEALFVVLVPHASIFGRLYAFYHKRHGLDIHLFNLGQLEALGARAGWTVDSLQSVLPFALVAGFRKTS